MRALDKYPDWTPELEMLAGLTELVSYGNRLIHAAHFKPPHPDVIDIPRPYARASEEFEPVETRKVEVNGSIVAVPVESPFGGDS